ncbi:MAG: phosphotransferase family protein [Microthrixaceae bacterium]|jgi:aminoglycoside phosphotransferase (APT) family kinase protein|nr:phosphotransferase family protein [Microthrixaceae bacterium]
MTVTDHPSPTPGVAVPAVTAWFEANVAGVVPPLDFELIAGGRSNLTFRVDDAAGSSWVLRRPPLGHVLATAHDMGREHRIISALADTDVPVPATTGICTDIEVNEAPFYVMEYLDGLVLRDAREASQITPDTRRRAGLSIAETLARIHAVDPDAVGLGDLGRKEDYIARQLKRWNSQFESGRTREVPEVTEAFQRLSAAIPEQRGATIVHGDYRLDNCMLRPDGTVMAVLDWEICTLGDPLADLGLLMVYWTEADDPFAALPGSATALEGFPTRAELIDAYATASGREVGALDYYQAFGYWKLACILEGVFTRYKAGAMGNDGADADAFGAVVTLLAQGALSALDRVGS